MAKQSEETDAQPSPNPSIKFLTRGIVFRTPLSAILCRDIWHGTSQISADSLTCKDNTKSLSRGFFEYVSSMKVIYRRVLALPTAIPAETGYSSSTWETSPSASLGSNQVDFGGMTLLLSATAMS